MVITTRLFKKLGWTGYYYSHSLFWRWKFREKPQILGRYACLGADVLRLIQPSHQIVNIQKGRVDYLVECWENPQLKARARQVVPYMKREEIIPCIVQEELLFEWLKPQQPVALFMDSMAELGDQLFVNRNQGWRFLSAYTDVEQSEEFQRAFRADGLLPIEYLDSHFRNFFLHIRKRFGNIPIFYLHFPTTLDSREKFRTRHAAILETINHLSLEFQPFYSLWVADWVVDFPEERTADMWNFPYHYNSKTYETFAQMVRATGCFET